MSTDLFPQRVVAAFAVASADLQHHHDKHGHVEQKHQAEVTDAGGVEDGFIGNPAADKETPVQTIKEGFKVFSHISHFIIMKLNPALINLRCSKLKRSESALVIPL